MAKINNFSKFINEASYEGNVGIPGEEGEGKPSYLRRAEKLAADRGRAFQQENSRDIQNFMGLVGQARQLQAGKEKELEELAEATIRNLFGSVLDGVTLNIKFAKDDEIPKMMEESPNEPIEIPELEELKDANIISAIQVRKISNGIMQGNAKNTKLCLNLDDTFEGLVEIFGEENAEKMRDLLTRITNVADFYDWNIPIEMQKTMWASRQGFSGSVQVEWKESNEETEDLAKKVLDDIAAGEDIVDNPDVEELFNETEPTVNALGTDFAMLLHEGVKGVYMLIAALSIPEDEQAAGLVVGNTDSLADEIEDLRYGPQMARDLRDFVNELDISRIPDSPESRLFGKLLEISTELEDKPKFLRIFNAILLSRFEEDELNDEQKEEVKKAYVFCQKLIDSIADELEAYYSGQSQSQYDEDEPDEEFYSAPAQASSEMSKEELMAQLDDALDRGDEAEFKRISALLSQLGESRKYVTKYGSLNESREAGRKYVVRKAVEKKLAREMRDDENEEELDQRVKDYLKTITPEEEKKILDSDPDFQEIDKMLAKNPGLMVPFLRWRKEEGASIEALKNQLASYTGLNQLTSKVSADEYTNIPKYIILKTQNPKAKESFNSKTFSYLYLTDISDGSSVFLVKEKDTRQTPSLNKKNEFLTDFAKEAGVDGESVSFVKIREVNPELESLISKASEVQHLPGYERFSDRVRGIERLRKGDWLRKSLPTSAGRMFGKNVNLKKEFEESPEKFKEKMLMDAAILAEDPDMIKLFNKKISSVTSMDGLREYLDRRIASMGSNAEALLKQVESLSPGVECIYDDERYVLISVRSEDAQKALCSAANWCINQWAFWNYSKGRIQFTIFDFEKPQTDANYMLGFTCERNGSVHAAHDVNDTSVVGNAKNYEELLRNRNYPESLISALNEMFEVEASIKMVTDNIYGGGSSPAARISSIVDNALKSYLTAERGTESAQAAYASASRIALRVIVDDFLREPLSYSDYSNIMDSIKKQGILIDQVYLIFKAVFPKATKSQVNSILSATNLQIGKVKEAIRNLLKQKASPDSQRKIERANKLVEYVEAKILPKLVEDLKNAPETD